MLNTLSTESSYLEEGYILRFLVVATQHNSWNQNQVIVVKNIANSIFIARIC